MNDSVVQLSESAFHEILNFVAASSRLSERKSFYDSLRQLARDVLNLDEMVIGRCGGEQEESLPYRCSNFAPVLSLSDEPAVLPLSPCAGSAKASGCANAGSAGVSSGDASDPCNRRVVVCHSHKVGEPPLCMVSSTKERSPDELLALLKTLLPYVNTAMQRLGSQHGELTAAYLTPREREVLHWTAEGKGCWETGLIVGISERTVKFHLQNIYRKLNVVNRTQAVAKAAQIQLLQ
ncbi:helix-turn-helix transcriptional regulator [Aquabacterium sp. A7-Y]|uniref:helix-turn-helix domain-containing protein n=1 Tax=Aquabacterium sp. A7-Y TaxID=1349605 RepID=UPI00223D86A4|nr:helix-turn-helix transcriptional regulator [Aquabacterium sp. A7-Y]MCW7540986.1 helix-turn-helix transcriptional regulator [Aquabacterium sp. A7-Y]